jgi:hypothetical protein
MKDETYPAYDAFLAFNELYRRGRQLPYETGIPGVYGVLAEGDGDRCLVLANTRDVPVPLTLPGKPLSCRMTGGGRRFEEIAIPDAVPGESILTVTMKGDDA